MVKIIFSLFNINVDDIILNIFPFSNSIWLFCSFCESFFMVNILYLKLSLFFLHTFFIILSMVHTLFIDEFKSKISKAILFM